jgi:glycosyltransferase involved in cell wall biosynthesis
MAIFIINNKMQIGALIMVKNEEKSIKTTIDSLKGYINSIIVYDTGSTDDTISIIKNISNFVKYKIK